MTNLSERYIRNEQMLSAEENKRLREFSIAVVGCGGLGGHIIEMLARLGVGRLTLIDGDVFEPSNLNRQLLATPENLGQSKAKEAEKRVLLINPEVQVLSRQTRLEAHNAEELLKGHDLICDALDNIPTRLIIEGIAAKLQIPVVFGAIAGWYAQIGSVMPGDRLLEKLYMKSEVEQGLEVYLGNPSFTPALAASLQVAEAVKILLGKEGVLRNKLLMIDTLKHDYHIIDM